MASKCSQNSNLTQHEREAVNYSVWEFKEDNELHQISGSLMRFVKSASIMVFNEKLYTA